MITLRIVSSWCGGSFYAMIGINILNVIEFLFQSLIQFVNKHLNKINLEVTDLDSQVRISYFNFPELDVPGVVKVLHNLGMRNDFCH